MTEEEARKIYARLSVQAALSRAQIKANPFPHLERAARQIYFLEKIIDEALLALSGFDDFDLARAAEPNAPACYVETAHLRNRKAYNLLRQKTL